MSHAMALTTRYQLNLRAGDLRAMAARARIRDASRPINPGLRATEENFGAGLGSDRRESTVEIAQTIELGGDRGARTALVTGEFRLASADAAVLRREALELTAERFIAAWAFQIRLARLSEGEQLTRQAIIAASERYRAGASPVLERSRAEASALSQAVDRRRTEAELGIARRELAQSWGDSQAAFDSLVADPLTEPTPSPRLVSHPELERADANEALARARVGVAEAARIPDPIASGGLRRLEETHATGFVVGLELPLPLWNHGSGTLVAARQEHEAALTESRAIALRLQIELANAMDRVQSAAATYDTLRLRVRPARQQLIGEMLHAYRAGRLIYLDLIAEQRNLLETDLALVDAQADLWRSRVRLELLVGSQSPEDER